MLGQEWPSRWKQAIEAAERKGADSVRLQIGPPATLAEVVAAEEAMRCPIPEEFRRTLLEFAGEMDFFWFLSNKVQSPGLLNGIFNGSCAWNLRELVAWTKDVRWVAEEVFGKDSPARAVWQNKFPFQSIGNGEYIAINTAPGEDPYVVYLLREWDDGRSYLLGPSFLEFMDRWTQIGCPTDDIWARFIDPPEAGLNLAHPHVCQWREWFGMQ